LTVISVAPTDIGQETLRWKVPVAQTLENSPVPRGLRVYRGTAAVAALGANDETSVAVLFTFPNFVYQMKNLTIQFLSDDATSEFENLGILEHRPAGVGNLGVFSEYELRCEGAAFRAAVQSVQNYRPVGTFRHWIRGNDGDTLVLFLADMSNDASTAGDVNWSADFWEYDIEQCLSWPVNTPLPMIPY